MIELDEFGFRLPDDLDAEKQMLLAMLQDAIESWQDATMRGILDGDCITVAERAAFETAYWIFGAYDNKPFFSFAEVCHYLGLDPDFIRRRLLGWRRKVRPDVRDAG
jgi:hypothetical protein